MKLSRNAIVGSQSVQYEIYDFTAGGFDYAVTFQRAIRLMRMYADAKVTRIADNVVVAQTKAPASDGAGAS